MEYGGRKLTDLLKKCQFEEPQIAAICKQVLLALKYLHSIGKIHRDVKSDNILLNLDGSIRLVDFGLCTDISNGDNDAIVGSPYWMAPEVINGEEYTEKVDVWSSAIVAIEMAQGEPPLMHLSPFQVKTL